MYLNILLNFIVLFF